MGLNVGSALDELAALVPPPMGGVGSTGVAWLGSNNFGVPDWGVLKLHDRYVDFPTGNTLADPNAVYPYYYRAPVGPSGVGLLPADGNDPATDPMFNVANGGYTGGGDGTAHAGFANLPMNGGGPLGYPTWGILAATAAPGVVVSGIVSPGDRGVLALVTWVTGEDPTPVPATSVADIQGRCVAAILMGRGILSGGCDGDPGGIFSEAGAGARASGSFKYLTNPAPGYTVTLDLSVLTGGPAAPVVFTAVAGAPVTPFQFQVGGTNLITVVNLALVINTQLYPSLVIAVPIADTVFVFVRQVGTVGNTVVLSTTAIPANITVFAPTGGTDVVPSPYLFPGRAAGQYNLDEIHTGTTVSTGLAPFPDPAAGQVRLLTDPSAVTFTPGTVNGGLPILGGTSAAIGTVPPPVPFLPFDLGGGTAGNFFAYRLPYLKDYVSPTGLVYTPAIEKARFYDKLPPAAGPPGPMTDAGNYDGFTTDFWAYQLARYRHRFVLSAGAPALRRDGNFALVHFKRESFFEAYVRDGVVPTSDQVWSVNLVTWVGNVSPYDQLLNVLDDTSPVVASVASLVTRLEVFEDPTGTVPLSPLIVPEYKLDVAGVPSFTFMSGIKYYVPLRAAFPLPGTANLAITELRFSYGNLFSNGYRTHDKIPSAGPLTVDNRQYALNQNPAFVSLSAFSYEGTESPVGSGISSISPLFPANLGEVRRQRIEFGYADVTNPVTVDPMPGANVDYNYVALAPFGKGIVFAGDTLTPVFTRSAAVRLYFRRPLEVDVNGLPVPTPATGYTLVRTGGAITLYHSMREASDSVSVPYGNPINTALRGLSVTKDTSERFLDEIYRYPENWTPQVPPVQTQLQGPGLPAGPGPISVPVRPTTVGGWDGWYLLTYPAAALDNVLPNLNNALQVAGLPRRNPSYAEGLDAPFPSRGVVMYPQTNYAAGHDPVGFNYTGLVGDRVFVRAFDAGAANVGDSTVALRLWGVDFTDFQYNAVFAPGAQGMAVMVKVPGLTTWMDAGRTDGTGPSKQDLALDGAGCLVGATPSDVDPVSQLAFTDVVVNLGPGLLFLNGEVPARCPVLVKIILKDNVVGKALNFDQGEATPTANCRGLVGIDLIPPP